MVENISNLHAGKLKPVDNRNVAYETLKIVTIYVHHADKTGEDLKIVTLLISYRD